MDFKKIKIKKIKAEIKKLKELLPVERWFSVKTRKILSWTAFGFLLAVLIFILFPLLPIENNYSLKMVLSGSMEPAIKTGSIIMVKPVSDYQVGEIVTYQYGRHARDLTTHRIIGQQGDEFITKGDNNNAADINPIKKEQILGKVLLTVPYAGYAANFACSKFGLILLIFIPVLLIIGSESLKIFKEVKKMRKKKNSQLSKNAICKILIFLILISGFSAFGLIDRTNCYFFGSVVLENNYFQAGYWMPVLDPIGDRTVSEGELLEFSISATDPNGGPLTYSASNLPSGATFIGRTFSWIPVSDQVGTYPNIHFEVSDGKYSDFENITITVTAIPPSEISDVKAENITQNSADIIWKTNEPATSKVEYGQTTAYGSILENSDFVETHTISISGLAISTLYHFRVRSKNAADKEAVSGDYEFTTQ